MISDRKSAYPVRIPKKTIKQKRRNIDKLIARVVSSTFVLVSIYGWVKKVSAKVTKF